jgi:hypothetical protein
MALEMVLDTLDGLDESIQKLYVEKDGKFRLDVAGHDKNDKDRIPLSRLNQEIDKRKQSDAALNEIAESLIEDIPEDMRDIVPNLSPADKIKWIRNANKKGFFDPKAPENSPDSRRPGGKPPIDFKDMKPQTIMAMGYKK